LIQQNQNHQHHFYCLHHLDKHSNEMNHPNSYLEGEVMDVDGITGGYNFQAAWTTAFIAAQLKTNNQ